MTKHAVSRNAFRGLFALYALRVHHDNEPSGEHRRLKLFQSSDDIPDELLNLWSDRAELLGPEVVGAALSSCKSEIINGKANYDHASHLLHAVLREMEQKQQH